MYQLPDRTAQEKEGSSMSEVHVMPTRDIKEHEETILCWCKPKRDSQEPNLVIHNAFAAEYGDERNLE
jgi:hypothetical protein